MSKNFDMIATVDIDIKNPIVDETSFDNLLIIGPLPKVTPAQAPQKVGVYSSLDEVAEAGWSFSGEDADPVGLAAQVAFSQSPRPTAIFIAPQQFTENAVIAQETVAVLNKALAHHTTAYEKVGCSVEFNGETKRIDVVLTVPFAQADGHGLFQALAEFVEQGYTATIDGITVEKYVDFKKTVYDAQLLAMKKGDAPVRFTMMMFKEGTPEVPYVITISYPDPDKAEVVVEEEVPVADPTVEVEGALETVQRAVATPGWYVVCPAGVPEDEFEGIAAYIETQEKMFCYTEAGTDFADGYVPCVSDVYFRTMAVYGMVDPAVPGILGANEFLNVAWVASWLNHPSGSETAAFKAVTGIEPSELTTGMAKALEDANVNFFVEIGGKNVVIGGKTLGGEWADVIRFRDYLKNDMQTRVVNLFVVSPKVPYTDAGIALVQNQMEAALKNGQNVGGIAETEYDEFGNEIPGYRTSVPKASSIPASEKKTRKLYNCKFKARLAGAIHFADIDGSLTYEL